MLAGITNEAAHIIDPTVNISPMANYLFMFASTFLITILGTIVTTKIIEPRLGKYEGSSVQDSDLQNLSDKEKKAMTVANITFVAMVVGVIILIAIAKFILKKLRSR